jgi:hypothetical protein
MYDNLVKPDFVGVHCAGALRVTPVKAKVTLPALIARVTVVVM